MPLNRSSHLGLLGRVQSILDEMFPATILLEDGTEVSGSTGGINPRTQYDIGGGVTIEADVMFRIAKSALADCPPRDSKLTWRDPASGIDRELRIVANPGRATDSSWTLFCVPAVRT